MHTLLLTKDGELYVTGDNSCGEIGISEEYGGP